MVVLCALVFGSIPLSAQEHRVLPMAAYQRGGRFVIGLTPEQIRIKGVQASIGKVELDRSARRIVLLLDASRSMGGDGRGDNSWPIAMQLAKDFLELVQPDDTLALHTFAEKQIQLVGFTVDTGAIREALDGIPPPNTRSASKSRGTETNLGLALSEVLAAYADSWKVGDTILLISDGEYKTENEVSLGKVAPRMAERGVRLLLLRIGPLVRRFGEQLERSQRDSSEDTKRESGYAASKDMSDLANQTGGFTIAPWDHAEVMPLGNLIPLKPEVLKMAVQVAYAFARNSYRVELVLGEQLTKSRKIELEILDEKGKEEKRLETFYPKILPPHP